MWGGGEVKRGSGGGGFKQRGKWGGGVNREGVNGVYKTKTIKIEK